MIYPLVTVIGTAFITSSENGAHWVCLSACSGKKEQAIGSSRGGKNTKVHVLINDGMQLLKVILTGGQIHDSEAAIDLLKGIKLTGKKILADKAYRGEQIRFFIAEHGGVACIPDKANFRIKHDFDSQLYKQRKKSRAVFSANQELPPRLHSLRQIGCLF